jgi:hypothetical protein
MPKALKTSDFNGPRFLDVEQQRDRQIEQFTPGYLKDDFELAIRKRER